MSKSLKATLPVLQYVSKLPNVPNRKKILSELGRDPSIYTALREILLNAKSGNIGLTNDCKCCLRKHSSVIVKILGRKSINALGSRRKIVSQTGGFLPLLIPLVLKEIYDMSTK